MSPGMVLWGKHEWHVHRNTGQRLATKKTQSYKIERGRKSENLSQLQNRLQEQAWSLPTQRERMLVFHLRERCLTNPTSDWMPLLCYASTPFSITPWDCFTDIYGVKHQLQMEGKGLLAVLPCGSFRLIPRNGGEFWSRLLAAAGQQCH